MKYQPISCSLFDRIESLAVSHKEVEIYYLDNLHEEKIKGRIKDIFSQDGAEFLRIDDLSIRLDQIKSMVEIG